MIELLNLHDFYGCSKTIEIAKGLFKTPLTLKEALQQEKRKQRFKTR